MTQPRCSVVVPVYNRPATLSGAIQSVLDQTIVDLEVIVVDDASSEPVVLDPDVVDDSRVRVVTRPQNGGVAAAQNTGVAHATGRYVGFLHSDDRWLPDKLEHQATQLDDADARFIESATRRITTRGDTTVAPRLAGVGFDEVLRRDVRNLHIAGFLFERTLLEGIGGFDEDLRSYEDLDLLIRLLRVASAAVSSDPVAIVDQSGSDRLADSPWMPRARRQLIDKYEGALVARYGEFPSVWKDWAFRDALDLIEAGEIEAARRRLIRSIGRDPRRALRRLPALAATHLGERGSLAAARRYQRHLNA